jgi:hypothetical protein
MDTETRIFRTKFYITKLHRPCTHNMGARVHTYAINGDGR